jgi:predicted MFS family arabinose efflux permease
MVLETAAPFAIGLDGSAVYLGGALGAGIGGVVLKMIGVGGIVPTSIIIGLFAIAIAAAIRPETWLAVTEPNNLPRHTSITGVMKNDK